METEKSAGFVLYRTKEDKREYLLLKCVHRKEWGFAKGHLEGDETPKQAALREVYEEAHINEITELQMSEPIRITYTNHLNSLREIFMFAGETNQEPKVSEEHSEYAWVPYSEVGTYMNYPLELGVCRQVEEFIQKKKADLR